MKTKILALALGLLFALPCVLCAEEVEIQLSTVVGMSVIPGDEPLDDPEPIGENPTRPNNFRATINGHSLFILKLEPTIPSAHVTVIDVSSGSIVVNEQFTTSLLRNIAASGTYALCIETDGGALVGQFIVR